MNPPPVPELVAFLHRSGLAPFPEEGDWIPLSGGVSADIWRVDLQSGPICVKQALTRLRVEAAWEAPVSRNQSECAYLEAVGRIVPGQVPAVLARDPALGAFAMAWLDPARHTLWKTELLAGRAEAEAGAELGRLLGRVHARTAGDASLASQFDTGSAFHALRIEPYLLATADKHPDLADWIRTLARRTAETRLALVHGDVSPKNILRGADGPILLDAECAWYGDPAFDLAFCLTHIVAKARVVPHAAIALGEVFSALVEEYLPLVSWEPVSSLEARAALLLPVLALARVDGKSPLEYLGPAQREDLRNAARNAALARRHRLSGARDLLAA